MAVNGSKKKKSGQGIPGPTNPMVTPMLTDQYQFTMAYTYWKAGKHQERAVFDLYFRKNPFGGEYTVFAGLEECVRFVANYKLNEEDIDYIKNNLSVSCEDGFLDYLRRIDCSDVEVYAIPEGSVVFPKVPLLRIEGPIAVVQLLETPFVNLINFASLVSTNAARHRFVAGKTKTLLEFGLRRAQGPDGGVGASKYSYIGGFDATSNVAAGMLFGIPLRGTHSHAFVSSFMNLDEIKDKSLRKKDGSSTCKDFVSLVQSWLRKIERSNSLHGNFAETNQSELAAFTSYALAFPHNFLALVDTYDVMRSGIPNFCAVALALSDLGYKAIGIRLDSGDLAYLSCEVRKLFCSIEKEFGLPGFGKMSITASNDLNEETLDALNKQGHEIDAYGIGTYLVTCYAQAALGVVFKLVEINNKPRIKISEAVSKVTIPCKKRIYRLYGKDGYALVDILTGENEPSPKVGERILCRHPFEESKRAYVVPRKVEELLRCYCAGSSDKKEEILPPLKDIRERCIKQLEQMRSDHMRRLNPTPYKVSVSAKLYDFIHFLWLNEAPVGELR
ncbi:Nicotinate phosphoribosyltransferase 2 [Glycine soja]|uniref:Nicotinate phosphoribosyltransferase n=1 Tax=Glycine soja TaxID=3848 RepID=A0A445M562_GLYSO|nr:nicotinate phosphoribosyltransferase 2-like [Glycine soja]KHN36239.1 Nicotinate phosphoribosyltransferase [Glycine soja]RZC30688.1 Nicotinate phosphoribosyltransferase 2 [Glycine soja]